MFIILNLISSHISPLTYQQLNLVFWQNLGLGLSYHDIKTIELKIKHCIVGSSYETEKYFYFHSPLISIMIIFNVNNWLQSRKSEICVNALIKCCIEKIFTDKRTYPDLRFVFECLSDIFNKYDIATIHHE